MSEKRRYDRPPSYTSQSNSSRGEDSVIYLLYFVFLFLYLYFVLVFLAALAALYLTFHKTFI